MDDWHSQSGLVSVLGEFHAVDGGQLVATSSRQVGRIGALLASEPGQPIARDRIVDVLWGTNPPATYVNTLQVHVSQLRSLLGPDAVTTTTQGYALACERPQVDAEWFYEQITASLDTGTEGDIAGNRQRLASALALWRGQPYDGIDDPLVLARRFELTELRERGIELQLELDLLLARSTGDLGRVVAAARGQVSRCPLREVGYEVLIRALIRDGRPAEAQEVFREAQETFMEQVHVQPSKRLSDALET